MRIAPEDWPILVIMVVMVFTASFTITTAIEYRFFTDPPVQRVSLDCGGDGEWKDHPMQRVPNVGVIRHAVQNSKTS